MIAGQVVLMDVATSSNLATIALPVGSFPFEIVVAPDQKRALVSLWGKSSITVLDLETMTMVEQWPVRSHPTEMFFVDDAPDASSVRQLKHAEFLFVNRALRDTRDYRAAFLAPNNLECDRTVGNDRCVDLPPPMHSRERLRSFGHQDARHGRCSHQRNGQFEYPTNRTPAECLPAG